MVKRGGLPMGTMVPAQRMYAELKFRQVMGGLYGDAFESFFHRLMELRHPGYVPVRTHGSLGDQGADGMSLHQRRLYACYGPQVLDATEVRKKFHGDLAKALQERRGQFDTFVFVHNDQRGGIHPEIVTLLARARDQHTSILFEQMGPQKLERCHVFETPPQGWGIGIHDRIQR
jgi:hypothetical protein